MRSVYVVGGQNMTLGAVTGVTLHSGTTASLEITRMEISQSSNTSSAQQRVQFVTQVTAFPTVTAATPQKTNASDQASVITGGTAGAAGTSGIIATAEGGGAKTVLWESAFSVLNGYTWIANAYETLLLPASFASTFSIFFPVAPTNTAGWDMSIWFREW